jgi:hypothetical protein
MRSTWVVVGFRVGGGQREHKRRNVVKRLLALEGALLLVVFALSPSHPHPTDLHGGFLLGELLEQPAVEAPEKLDALAADAVDVVPLQPVHGDLQLHGHAPDEVLRPRRDLAAVVDRVDLVALLVVEDAVLPLALQALDLRAVLVVQVLLDLDELDRHVVDPEPSERELAVRRVARTSGSGASTTGANNRAS